MRSSHTFCVPLKMLVCVHFVCLEPLMIEHRISMAAIFNFLHKTYSTLNSREGDVMNTVDATESNVFWCCHLEMMYER